MLPKLKGWASLAPEHPHFSMVSLTKVFSLSLEKLSQKPNV
jgi:hypothetical protein